MRRSWNWMPVLASAGFVAVVRYSGAPPLGANAAATLLAVLAAVAVAVEGRRASPIDRGLAGFLGFGAAGLWIGPVRPLVAAEPTALLYAALCAVAVGPLLLGREPFTTHFARRRTPEAVWSTPLFLRINRELTAVWAALFAGAAAVSLAPGLLPGVVGAGPWAWICRDLVPPAVLLGFGVPFTRLYPAWRQRGAARSPVPWSGAPSRSPQPQWAADAAQGDPDAGPTVVAVNGSPHRAVGNTSRLIEMMRPPLEAAGFRLEEVFLSEKDIRYCTGCGFCLEHRGCWIRDDHGAVVRRLLAADAVILASPVYFSGVTAQTKTFLDRCLPYGHKPRTTWKPGLAVSVSAGLGETDTAHYLEGVLRVFGAYPVGSLTALAVGPGRFLGREEVAARAEDLAADLVRAVRGGRRHPVTERDLRFWQFMGALVRENREFMADDHRHWEAAGLYASFERYAGQRWSAPEIDPEVRAEWLQGLMDESSQRTPSDPGASGPTEPHRTFETCRELLAAMPEAFRPEAAGGVETVYQFEVADEGLVAHLRVAGGTCTFAEGPAEVPDVVIETPGSVWLAVSRGELDGQEAFLSGKYRVRGDLARLMQLPELFDAAA